MVAFHFNFPFNFKLIFFILFGLYIFKCNNNLNVTLSPSPQMRPEYVTHQFNYDLFYCFICDILFLILFFYLVLINIACRLIQNTRYISLDTCLDTLPRPSVTPKHNCFFLFCFILTTANVYLIDGYLLLFIVDFRLLIFSVLFRILSAF